MRFIAVYEQARRWQGRSFSSSIDALDFLFWGYEDGQLLPHGLYDCLTDEIILYTHAGTSLATINPNLIRSTAAALLAINQPIDLHRL